MEFSFLTIDLEGCLWRVMPRFVPGIDVLIVYQRRKTWMAGIGPAMTEK
jgi:hypothetical protein